MRHLSAPSLPPARPRWRRPSVRRYRMALRYGAALITAACLGGSGFWLWHSGTAAQAYGLALNSAVEMTAQLGLQVEDVLVEGRKETRADAILAALDVKRGAPLLAVDLAAAKARLEALPWVRKASLERRWPRLLYVKIEERTPLALWQHGGVIGLIDRDGKEIKGADIHRFSQLPMVVGEGAPEHASMLLDMFARWPAVARHVAAAVWVGDRRWNLHLQEGIDVRLPESDAEAAFGRLAALEAKDHLFARDIVMIDLRLPDRVIVRLSPEAAQHLAKPGKNT